MRELIRLTKHSLGGIQVVVKVRVSNNKYMPGRHFCTYGKLQSYSCQSCSARKTVGRKHLFLNALIPIVLFTLSQNNVCLDMASCDIQKYFMLIYAIGQNQLNVDLDLKPMPLSLSLSLPTYVLSISPQSTISRSLFLCSLSNSPICFTCIDST